MKRSRKQQQREARTADMVRHREAIKATAVLRELYLQLGGQVAWQQYLDQCRRERNERTRTRVRAIVAAKRAAAAADESQVPLFESVA